MIHETGRSGRSWTHHVRRLESSSLEVTLIKALDVNNLSKTFEGTRALNNIDLSVAPAEIRAIVGQNGCGKSTLIKILAGYHQPDDGAKITINDKQLNLGKPRDSFRAGLRFVHQDLALVHDLDTVDNIALGNGYRTGRFGQLDRRASARAATSTLLEFGYRLDVRQPIKHLTISQRTAVAVARALSNTASSPQVLILDEPTANLPAAEVERLFDLVRSVKAQGVAVIFVSHHLEEVFSLADTISVLRDGRNIHIGSPSSLSHGKLVELMIGKALPPTTGRETRRTQQSSPLLELEHLSTEVLKSLTLSVSPGEIVGVAGITGSGREDVAPALFGAVGRTGAVRLRGKVLPIGKPHAAIRAGMALVPADRHTNATFENSTIRENLTIVKLETLANYGRVGRKRELQEAVRWLTKVRVRPLGSPERVIATLSGGNQQKIVLARWLRHSMPVLILDSPTQGVDVGSKAELHRLIRDAAASGAATLIVSTDHEELAAICDSVIVLSPARTSTRLQGASLTPEHITSASFGGDFDWV